MCKQCEQVARRGDAVGPSGETNEEVTRFVKRLRAWLKREGVTDYMVNLTMGDSALVVTGGDEGKVCMNLAGAINREMSTFLPIIAGAIALGTGYAMALVELDSDIPDVSVH